jgi:hypothetical protein
MLGVEAGLRLSEIAVISVGLRFEDFLIFFGYVLVLVCLLLQRRQWHTAL